MNCPKCDQPNFHPVEPCPQCQFTADPALLEELAHIEWMLTELDTWHKFGVTAYNQQLVEKQYTSRQRELEVILGLRLPSFNQAEARAAWPDLIQREILLEKVEDWLEAGLIRPIVTRTMVEQARNQVDDLREQLEGYARPNFPRTDSERLDTVNFLLEAVAYVRQRQGFTSSEAEQKILPSLLKEQEQLEIKLGLRPAASEQPASPPKPKSPPHRTDSQPPHRPQLSRARRVQRSWPSQARSGR